MKIDIIVAFNDVSISLNDSNKLGRNIKTLRGKPLSIVDQMVIMSKSLKMNWSQVDYALYATHSNPLSDKSRSRLVEAGYTIVHMTDNLLPDRVCNRINAYHDFTDGDYSMVCDCDLVFLRPEEFDLTKMVSAKLRGQINNGIFDNDSDQIWKMLYEINNIPVIDAQPLHYHAHFNNGCIFVDNKRKHILKSHILSCTENVLKVLPTLNRYKRSKHFLEEVIVSLAVAKTENYAILPEKFNAIISGCNGTENYSMIHYASFGRLEAFTGYNIGEILK